MLVRNLTEYLKINHGGENRTIRQVMKDHWFDYLLFLPTLLFLLLIVGIPFIQGVWMSFHQWPLQGGHEWIGLGNYTYLWNWDVFWTSVRATLIYATTTVGQLVIAILAALLVKHIDIEWLKSATNATFLVPYAMPPVVTGMLWTFLLEPNAGPFFGYLVEWGLLQEPIFWDVNGDTAMATVMGVMAWTFWPFMFLIILSTLESIPEEYYESARIYGANRIEQFRYVTLPQLKSAIMVAVSIRLVWNLAKVSQPLQLTGGGPGYETSILAILMYRFAWQQGRMGMSFAVGMVLLAISLIFVFLFIREFESSREAKQ